MGKEFNVRKGLKIETFSGITNTEILVSDIYGVVQTGATINNLTDVDVSSATNGQYLSYFNGEWLPENSSVTHADGISGNIQYNDGGTFAGSNDLFWDITNNRLGIQTNTPSSNLEISASNRDSAFISKTIFSGTTGFSGGLQPNIIEWQQIYNDVSSNISISGLKTIVNSDDDANNVSTLIGNQIELYAAGSDTAKALEINIYGGGMGTTNFPLNLYGIYIEDINSGVDSNYAIYTNDGLIRIGELGTGTTVNNLGIDSTGVVVVGESGIGSTTLSGLSDVSLETILDGEILSYSGGSWVNINNTNSASSLEYEIKHNQGLGLLLKEFIYTGTTLGRIDYYDLSGGTIIYTKEMNYTSSILTSCKYTKNSDSSTETLTYIYDGGLLINTVYT